MRNLGSEMTLIRGSPSGTRRSRRRNNWPKRPTKATKPRSRTFRISFRIRSNPTIPGRISADWVLAVRGETGDVPARAVEPRDDSADDGVGHGCKNDRDRPRLPLDGDG